MFLLAVYGFGVGYSRNSSWSYISNREGDTLASKVAFDKRTQMFIGEVVPSGADDDRLLVDRSFFLAARSGKKGNNQYVLKSDVYVVEMDEERIFREQEKINNLCQENLARPDAYWNQGDR